MTGSGKRPRSVQDSIMSMADPLFDVGLFKDPKVAKRVLAQVAADVFNQFGSQDESLKKFDEFISGRVEPKFDKDAKTWGMLPNLSEGITYWIVPVKELPSEEDAQEKYKQLSKELLTIGPDTSIRSLTRFFLLSSDSKRSAYISKAEDEIKQEK